MKLGKALSPKELEALYKRAWYYPYELNAVMAWVKSLPQKPSVVHKVQRREKNDEKEADKGGYHQMYYEMNKQKIHEQRRKRRLLLKQEATWQQSKNLAPQ